MWVAKRFITFLNSRKKKLIVVINICNKHDLMYRKLRQRWMLAGTLQNINVRRSEITKNGMFAVFFKSVSNTIFGPVHVTLPLRWLMMIFWRKYRGVDTPAVRLEGYSASLACSSMYLLNTIFMPPCQPNISSSTKILLVSWTAAGLWPIFHDYDIWYPIYLSVYLTCTRMSIIK